MSFLDVVAMVRSLRATLLGMRVSNVYDVDARTYTLKFGRGGGSKATLLVESGVRFHTTSFARRTGTGPHGLPNGFATKLRKHLNNRVLSSIAVLGADRIVDFTFGAPDAVGDATGCYHVILELYAKGNLILTDAAYTILALLRVYEAGDAVRAAVREVYPHPAPPPAGGAWLSTAAVTRESVRGVLDAAGAVAVTGKAKARCALRVLLASRSTGLDRAGPVLAEHALCAAGVDPDMLCLKGWVPLTDAEVDAIVAACQGLPAVMAACDEEGVRGFCIEAPGGLVPPAAAAAAPTGAMAAAAATADADGGAPLAAAGGGGGGFVDFTPVLLAQHRGARVAEFASFSEAVDAYYGVVDAARAVAAAAGAGEDAAAGAVAAAAAALGGAGGAPDAGAPVGKGSGGGNAGRLARLIAGQNAKLAGLAAAAEAARARAARLTSLAPAADAALGVLRAAVAHGVDWGDLAALVARDTAAGNPIAALIAALALENGRATLRLPALDSAEGLRALAAATGAPMPAAAASAGDVNAPGGGGGGGAVAGDGRSCGSAPVMVPVFVGTTRAAVKAGAAKGAGGDQAARGAGGGGAAATVPADADAEAADTAGAVKAGKAAVARRTRGRDARSTNPDYAASMARAQAASVIAGLAARAEAAGALLAEVDLSLSAAANATALYASAKEAEAKAVKTRAAFDTAVARATLSSGGVGGTGGRGGGGSTKPAFAAARKLLWFERFHWFVSADGLLVIGGRDAQQNEQLVKRYLRPQDAYVHADVHGGSSIVVRSPSTAAGSDPAVAIAPSTFSQAGTMAVCRSGTWSAGVAAAAWWVRASQVSKTAQSGEFLTTGSFVVRGRKNMIGVCFVCVGGGGGGGGGGGVCVGGWGCWAIGPFRIAY